jgi:hypothetical protein
MKFDPKILKDPEVIKRVKRRAGPGGWTAVPGILACLEDVLTKAMPPAPDPMAPKPEPKKRKRR